jgi:RimK family alpha-L-glutamate ligase
MKRQSKSNEQYIKSDIRHSKSDKQYIKSDKRHSKNDEQYIKSNEQYSESYKKLLLPQKRNKTMKKGLILVNAYLEMEAVAYQANRLKEELERLGIAIDIERNNFFPTAIIGGRTEISTPQYDFCVYLDKDKYVSLALEKAGIRLFNSHAAVQACDDKMTTHILLSDSGIPMPKTLSGLLCYAANENKEIPDVTIEQIEKTLGYPVIIKESFGSCGQGVFLAKSRSELAALMQKVKCRPHFFQEFVGASRGRDARIIVIGGRAVGGMKRKSDKDFRSNIELGGVGSAFEMTPSFAKMAEKISQLLKLDYCGIDLLFDEDEQPIFCEVNSNAFFGGFEKATGINVAGEYAKHIAKTIYGEKIGWER